MSQLSDPGGLPQRLPRGHDCWPPLWREMNDPPVEITVAGQEEHLTRPALAIVGTRAATPRGLAVAEGLARALAAAGWVIVSGLARGIDAAAHRGALGAGGVTVAIMGTGVDRTFPAGHAALRRRIEGQGCVVTELPDGAPPLRHHFPKRNRLIAGMAQGVLVVEAPLRSGALLTAYLGLDLCREVFAVPGPVDRPESRGCHHLLKQGATLVEEIEDVHRVLAPPAGAAGASVVLPELPLPVPGSAARWIWDRLDLEGTGLEELRVRWAGGPEAWAEGLVALEMAGLIRRLPGGVIARRLWHP
jgi:DNA processing protein